MDAFAPDLPPETWEAIAVLCVDSKTRARLRATSREICAVLNCSRVWVQERSFVGLFLGAVRRGLLDSVKWMAGTFSLTADDARVGNISALPSACKHGHLEVAQWLTAYFALTADDVRSQDNRALHFACKNGHLSIARWLTVEFSLSNEDLCSTGGYALRKACGNGHLPVVQWLVGESVLKGAHVDVTVFMLGLACENGHLSVAQWLAREFGLTSDVARVHNCLYPILPNVVAFRRHYDVARWLEDTFGAPAAEHQNSDAPWPLDM